MSMDDDDKSGVRVVQDTREHVVRQLNVISMQLSRFVGVSEHGDRALYRAAFLNRVVREAVARGEPVQLHDVTDAMTWADRAWRRVVPGVTASDSATA